MILVWHLLLRKEKVAIDINNSVMTYEANLFIEREYVLSNSFLSVFCLISEAI